MLQFGVIVNETLCLFFKIGFGLHMIINYLELHFYHSKDDIKSHILLLAAVH